MIEWFGGSSRSETKYASGDDGATFIEDAPETPAPVFVVRAFKTAIFGTPKPIEYKNIQKESHDPTKQQAVDPIQAQPSMPSSAQTKHLSGDTGATSRGTVPARDSVARDKQDQLMSPTKGILLTPGTAATRRKTVSFSAQKEHAGRTQPADYPVEIDSKSLAHNSNSNNGASEVPRKQSALTKTLIELSTKRSSPPIATGKLAQTSTRDVFAGNDVKDEAIEHSKESGAVSDLTLDLSQPRSRSGQHWKAEYDEYHKNSTREMKRILQHGQNVKSYAAKKDSEATSLNEKLQKELAKATRMEARVSKMAKQLKAANAQNPYGDSEQARLVGELAQQTAMAVRYQKKAEQYRKAIQRLPSNIDIDDQALNQDHALPQEREDLGHEFSNSDMQAEMNNLREIASSAEKKAARLEDENRQLKRSLARVKDEMTTYDLKRQAKEERLKRRDDRHKAAKETCEAELEKLKIEYNTLVQASRIQGKASEPEVLTFRRPLATKDVEDVAMQPSIGENPPAIDQILGRRSSNSPRKRRPDKTAIDIWTVENPEKEPERERQAIDENLDVSRPPHEDHELREALQEIIFNPPLSEVPSMHQGTKESQLQVHPENVRPNLKHVSRQEFADNPIDSLSPLQRISKSSMGRSASLLSNRVASRTSTMGTARTSSLSVERAAAAKARLAERKKSGEKKKMKVDENVANLR